MKPEIVKSRTDQFEAHAQNTDSGLEFWLARDIQHLLGYTEWRNFSGILIKAKTACEGSGHPVSEHFVEVTKMVDVGSGGQREIDDQMLTRHACHLIAPNGDPKKREIACVQTCIARRIWKTPQTRGSNCRRSFTSTPVASRNSLPSPNPKL